MAGQVEAMVTWEILGSIAYRARIADGWRDTGHRRQWCGGAIITAMMVKNTAKQHNAKGLL